MSTETVLSRVTEKVVYAYKYQEVLLSALLDIEITFSITSIESQHKRRGEDLSMKQAKGR